MLTRNLLIGLLLTATFAGCTAPGDGLASPDLAQGPDADIASLAGLAETAGLAAEEGEGPAAAPPGSGDPRTHGDPTYKEGGVSSSQANTGGHLLARVEQTFLVQNDIGGADRIRFDGAIRAGDVTVQEWDHGGYRLVITLIGEGATVADARKAFDTLSLVYDESFEPGSLGFSFGVQHASYSSGTLGETPVSVSPIFRSAQATLYVPASDMLRVDMSSTSGSLNFEGLSCAQVDAASSTGDIRVADSNSKALFVQSAEGDLELYQTSAVDAYVSRTLGKTLLHYVDAQSAVVDVADDATFRHSTIGDLTLNAEDVEGNAALGGLQADVYSFDMDILPTSSGTFEVQSIDDATVTFETQKETRYDALAGSLTGVDIRLPGAETINREAPAGYDYGEHARDPFFGSGQSVRAVVQAEGTVSIAG